MIYFSADTHFSDERHSCLGRPFANVNEMNNAIIRNFQEILNPTDTLYFLGDVFGPAGGDPSFLADIPGEKHLILGDYDVGPKSFPGILDKLVKYFVDTGYNAGLQAAPCRDEILYLVHKPEDAKKEFFNLVGHVHSGFRVQRNMINVGVDAWHFRPVSLERIVKVKELIRSTYDINIFAGELEQNYKVTHE